MRALTTPLHSTPLRSSGLLLLLRLQHARGDREPSRMTGTGHLPREQVQRTVVAGLRPLSRLTLQHTHDVVSFSGTLHRDTLSWLSCCIYLIICLSVCRFVEGNLCQSFAHCFVLFCFVLFCFVLSKHKKVFIVNLFCVWICFLER